MLRGRDRELSMVVEVLDRAASSRQSHIVAVEGEPGIGKSALLAAAAENARRLGYAVGVGKAEEIGQAAAAGAPLLIALRSGPQPLLDAAAFAELGALYGDRPLWLVDRVASMIEELARTTPVLLVVDDLQWADELTRFALNLLPSRASGSPVVWLTASRPGSPADGSIDDAHHVADRPERHHITLGPLSADALEELAHDRLGTPPTARTALLLRTVGGNPFWAVRMVDTIARDGDAELPTDLILGVQERLPDDPDLLELLRTCAVWGRPLPLTDAAALLGLSLNRVLAAAAHGSAAGLLHRGGSAVGFRHDLIREAVYADLTPVELDTRHRLCRSHLLRTGASALTVAPHITHGADTGDMDAVRTLLDAAAEAAATMPGAAADLAHRAFALVEPGRPEQLQVGETCATLLVRLRRGPAAITIIDQLLDGCTEPDDRARLQVQASLALLAMDRLDDIARRVDPVLAGSGLSERARVALQATRTLPLIRQGSTRDAAHHAAAALEAARAVNDLTAQRLALITLTAVAKQEGRHESAYRRTRELRELAGEDHVADEIRCLQLLDRYDDAARLLADAVDGAPTGVDARSPDLVHAQMWQHVNLGRLDAAETEAQTLLRLADELGQHTGSVDAQSVLAFIALMHGEPDQARHHLQPRTPREPHLHHTARRLMIGWIALLDGDPDTAATLFAPLAASAESSRDYWPWFPLWTRPIVQSGIATGNRELASDAVRLAVTGAERNPGITSFAGLALQVRGLADGDPDTLADAVSVLRRGPRPLMLASAITDHGTLLLAGGATDLAVERLTEARQLYTELGAPFPAALVDRALTTAAHRPASAARHTPRPPTGWEALTDAELRVAQLIGAGNTNRTAATTLGISPNTVGTHLRAVYTKLDIQSRVQLANRLHERNRLPAEPAGQEPTHTRH